MPRPSPARPAALLALALALAVAAPATAAADPHLPPPGEVFAGVTGGKEVDSFTARAGKHPPVFQFFTTWGGPTKWAFSSAAAARARPMLHVSTATHEGGPEVISPAAIARGEGDAYLLALNAQIAQNGIPTYVRLMSEMNGHWNPYSAFGRDGRPRGADHSTAAFKQAWRRTVLIVRGGAAPEIDGRLRSLGMPAIAGGGAELPRPPVAFQWVPQTAGSPDIRANAAAAYWPGGEYVDWVGTDFYSRYPNFRALDRFARQFRGKPFVFGEWAVWGRDDPAFVRRFAGWVRSHPAVRMLMYNQGGHAESPFRLERHHRSAAALSHALAAPRYAAYPPEYR